MSPTTLARLSVRAIARSLGLSPETPSQRGATPTRWPIDDLLRLSEAHPTIADALRDLFAAAEAEPTPCTAERATAGVVRAMGAAVAAIMDRLDGGLDDGELRDTEADLASLAAQVSQARALIRRNRKSAP